MKKIYWVFIFVGILLHLVVIFTILWNEINPSFGDPHGDLWYEEDIKAVACEYIRQLESPNGRISVTGWGWGEGGFDQEIEKSNREREDKIFPFERVEIQAETADYKYTLYAFVNENGELKIENYERQKNFNPFLMINTEFFG